RRMLNPVRFGKKDLFFHNGLYSSFFHHSSFSKPDPEDCLKNINDVLEISAKNFKDLSCFIITFGSSYRYYFKENGEIVANCHKRPETDFLRERASVEKITEEWAELIPDLLKVNPALKIIFTVSPIRHFRDGAHNNQISKATLLLSVQCLMERYPENVSYFPAYEIMMDELRDYRFYAEDMIHPSPLAINHIWERFCETYMTGATRNLVNDISGLNKSLNHRLLNNDNEGYKIFLKQTLLKIERLKEKNPYICLTKDEIEIKNKIDEFESKQR
ncbi:MAG: GSCFA domain-containing protein, partial [Tannerella sp.]|nr:GSCFA domain-containing protein [Tannerella sp.]